MQVKKVYLGYWYQRTSLHLSELYDFLESASSPLNLDPKKLKELHAALELESIKLKVDVLEYIEIISRRGVVIKIFEDGLVLLSSEHEAVDQDIKKLTDYFEKAYSPVINYLFSLGAPVPNELVNLKSIPPCMIVTHGATHGEVAELFEKLGEKPYFEISGRHSEVFRGDRHYVVNVSKNFKHLDELIGSFIFFREFKMQLHHYLNLHRIIWEEISEVKEKRTIKGSEISGQRNQIESYKKTVSLINGRITQMGLYIDTRSSIVRMRGWEGIIVDILDFKYQNLQHNLDYLASIWNMTTEYVNAAVEIFNELSEQSTKKSVEALTLISSIGVVTSVIDFLQVDEYPVISSVGAFYFLILLLGTLLLNKVITYIYQSFRYKIKDVKITRL